MNIQWNILCKIEHSIQGGKINLRIAKINVDLRLQKELLPSCLSLLRL